MKISVFFDHVKQASVEESCSIEKILDSIKKAGISGIEMEDRDLFDKDYDYLEMIKKSGMKISCVYGFYTLSKEDEIKRAYKTVDFAKENDIKNLMFIPGFLNSLELKIPFLAKRKADKYLEGLSKVVDYAKENGICMLLEDFDNRIAYFSTSKGLSYFIDNIKDLYCTFDTGNFLYSEEDALTVLPLFLKKIKHVHLKDRSLSDLSKNKEEKPLLTIKGRELFSSPVGFGCIPMKEIIQDILETGYDGYFAIEHFGSVEMLSFMLKSAEFLSQYSE